MAEVLFILTTIFVAYVVYVVIGDQMTEIKAMTSKSSSEHSATVTRAAAEVQVVAEKPVAQTVAAQKPATKKTASSSSTVTKDSLKNPETGEVVNMPTNYRFAKRWIKEALVQESLLDKIYKTNELDDKTNAKIKRALNKLSKMEQYKV
ncbi:MAG: hypothetical protein CVV13_09530 [Gammaproteobacteria bacterium HGW-Gammaproteobacteria-3]|jgi:hypothetical protein|nr:MAG: hypothetical protein CVV13_09530 [Gammaproteobacteria bacterium HGW-Gammaproteobacteria-3]